MCIRSTLSDQLMDQTLPSEGWADLSNALGIGGRLSSDPARDLRVGLQSYQGDDMDSPHHLGADRLSGRGLIALVLIACTAPLAAQAASCGDLAGMAIPASAIGLPTAGGTVTSATVVPAAGAGAAFVAEYCRVSASISPV